MGSHAAPHFRAGRAIRIIRGCYCSFGPVVLETAQDPMPLAKNKTSQRRLNPHFSPSFNCGGGSGLVYCIPLGRAP
jgi:hypothetical protein